MIQLAPTFRLILVAASMMISWALSDAQTRSFSSDYGSSYKEARPGTRWSVTGAGYEPAGAFECVTGDAGPGAPGM